MGEMSTVRKEEGGTEETQTQETGMWTRQEAGGMNWETGIEVCALPRAKHRAGTAWRRELGLVLCDDLMGGTGWGMGGRSKRARIYVCIKLIHLVV